MYKEIGGYFQFEQLKSNEYHSDLIKLNCGRNALDYLCKSRKIQKLYLPAFLCDSVRLMCEKNGYNYEIYHINETFHPQFDRTLQNNEYIYIVNYYGMFSKEDIANFKNTYKNIIFDNAHAFYQKPVKDIDTIYSCRKFFGVPDGAYLSTDALLGVELETDFSSERFKHLLGRYEGKAIDYYNDFKNNDEKFKSSSLRSMSNLTQNILGAIDYESSAKIRKENFKILCSAFDKINKINVDTIDVPYAYPLYLDNGMDIKKRLSQVNIYVATLWPNVLNDGNDIERDFSKNILPLPCDQRYNENDMNYIIEEVLKCINCVN